MNAPEQLAPNTDIEEQMKALLQQQRDAYLQEGVVTAETRIDRVLNVDAMTALDRLVGRVAVIKPQIAFFEQLGWRGMRVLLIHPADFPDPNRPPPLLPANQAPPLGLAYIGSFLREAGHEVCIIDMKHGGHSREQLMDEVRAFSPAVVGMGLYTVTVPVAEEISRLLKAWQLESAEG